LSGGAIIVKDSGITAAKIAANAVTTDKILDANVTTAKIANANVTTDKILDANVTTAKIADANVTKAKIENVADMKVLGNTSGTPAAPAEVSVLDEDDLVSNSATALATQQSIKAYVDNGGSSKVFDGYQYLPSGLLIQWGSVTYNGSDGVNGTIIPFPIPFPNACFSITANDYGNSCHSVSIIASSLSQLTCWGKNDTGAYTTTVIKYIAYGY
jgi:hypothetical protein